MGRLTIATKFNTARLLQFVFPAVAMMIVTSIYVMTDGIFISQFAGSEQLSATNIVYPVVYLLNGIGVMLSMAARPLWQGCSVKERAVLPDSGLHNLHFLQWFRVWCWEFFLH